MCASIWACECVCVDYCMCVGAHMYVSTVCLQCVYLYILEHWFSNQGPGTCRCPWRSAKMSVKILDIIFVFQLLLLGGAKADHLLACLQNLYDLA